MDPVCHTLVGASLAEAGLARRTALGYATLLIAANVPDVDVLSYWWGSTFALATRRGITHGLPALVVWPVVLLGIMLLWDRVVRRRRGRTPPHAVVPAQILLLAFVGTATHPTLDFLNSYGMRWLAPFSDAWFYGDTLFIVDPWVWGLLTAGIVATRRTPPGRRRNPARVALAVFGGYVLVMAGVNRAAREVVAGELAGRGIEPDRMMVAPTAVTPFKRWVVVRTGDTYRVGRFDFLTRSPFELDGLVLAANPDRRGRRALEARDARRFLRWARFPYVVVSGGTVWIGDARYTLEPEGSWAAVAIGRDP